MSTPRRAIDDKPARPKGGARAARGVEDESGPQRTSFGRAAGRFLLDAVIVLVVAVILSTLTRYFLFEQYRVPTGSMEETLMGEVVNDDGTETGGDHIYVLKLGSIERGDIVVFEDTLGWLTSTPEPVPAWQQALEFIGLLADSSERHLVKRVIGLPGDRVTCCNANGRIEVNGVEIVEDYLYTFEDGTMVNPSDYTFDVVVPENHIFVLGDHRNASADSRLHLCMGSTPTPQLGFISLDDVEGPVVAILYPFSRFTTFSTPEAFADVPDPAEPPPANPVVNQYPTC